MKKADLQLHHFSSEVKNTVSASYPWSKTICIPFLLMMVSSLFVLCQNYFGFLELHCFVSAGPPIFLLIYPTRKVWYPPLCINWKISSITLTHTNWYCMWLICTNYIISSCNLVLLPKLLHLLQRHLSDQVIVQRVKVSVASYSHWFEFIIIPNRYKCNEGILIKICTNYHWI